MFHRIIGHDSIESTLKKKTSYVHHPDLIHTSEQLIEVCKILNKENSIAVDTEFIREKTFFPIVALIQIGTHSESWLIDPIAFTKESIQPLREVLQNQNIVKIFHAASADQECFYTSYDFLVTPTFDTAIGAALSGFGESPGLSKLTKEILGRTLEKGHARTDWTVRPLPKQLTKYAHQDVQYLIELYEELLARLDKKGRKKWAFDLSRKFEKVETFEQQPEELAKRIVKNKNLDRRSYAALLNLIAWREKRVRALDIPRKWIADDDLLASLANVRPKDAEHLSAFRALKASEVKHSGADILEAIQRAEALSDKDLPYVPKIDQPDDDEVRSVEMLQFYFKLISDELEIAPKYLINSENILKLIRNRPTQIQELTEMDIFSEGAIQMVGSQIIEVLNGKSGLFLIDNHIKVHSR